MEITSSSSSSSSTVVLTQPGPSSATTWVPPDNPPKREDFPIVVVVRKDWQGNAGVQMVDAYEIQERSWDLFVQWYRVVAWKSIDLHSVNKEIGCYVNTSPNISWG
jgi:hypothetical protein